VGIGGRYHTNFGPLRIDIARAVNRTSRDPVVALYISLGQAF
jgi:translocation and assembly module TamA